MNKKETIDLIRTAFAAPAISLNKGADSGRSASSCSPFLIMKTKTIYAINRTGAHGDYMGPFFATEGAANKSVEEEKAASKWPLDIWVSKEILILENAEVSPCRIKSRN